MFLKCCQAEEAYLVLLGLREVYALVWDTGEEKKGSSTEGRPILGFIPRQDQEQEKKKNPKKREKSYSITNSGFKIHAGNI